MIFFSKSIELFSRIVIYNYLSINLKQYQLKINVLKTKCISKSKIDYEEANIKLGSKCNHSTNGRVLLGTLEIWFHITAGQG